METIAIAFSRKADEQVVTGYFLSEGYGVLALQQANKKAIDLVLLDTASAHDLGPERLQQLKARDSYFLPVLVVLFEQENPVRWLENGVIDDCVHWPIGKAELLTRAGIFLRIRRQTIALGEQQEIRYRASLQSIGDAVITTGIQGQVDFMNPVAEQLTGWREAEAKGQSLETVFNIINEETRTTVGNPVQKVLQADRGVVLDKHTLLISKDGTEISIADSGAPIRNDKSEIIGVALIFRDQTEERLTRRFFETRLALIEYAANHTLAEFLTRALDEVGAFVASPIGFYHFVAPDQKTLALQQWSTRTLKEFCQAEGRGLHYSIDQAGVWVDCVYQKKPVIHNDYASLPHKKGMPDGHVIVTRELVVPVLREDRVVAILGVGNKPTDYTQKDAEIVSYLADVTWEIVRQKQAEQALRDSEQFLKNVFDAIRDGISVLDNNLNVIKTNRWMEKMYLEQMPLAGRKCYQVYQQRHRPCPWCPSLRTLETGEMHSEVVPYPSAEKPTGWIELSTFPVKDKQNNVTNIIEFVKDITARKQAEQALLESEARNRALLNALPDLMFVQSRDGTYLDYHTTNPDALYLSPRQFMGKKTQEIFPEEFAKVIMDLIEQTVVTGKMQVYEYPLPIAGQLRYFEARVVPFGADRVLSVIREITERKQAEQALRESETRFRQLAEQIQDAFWLITTTEPWQVIYANPAFVQVWGVERKQVYRDRHLLMQPIPVAEQKRVIDSFNTFLQGHQDYDIEHRIVKPDGSIRWVWVRVFGILDETGKMYRAAGIAQDITERKRAEMIRTAQYNITRAMVTATDLNAIFALVRNELKLLIDTRNFILALYDEVSGMLQALFETDEKDIIPPAWNANRSVTGRVVRQKKSLMLTRMEIENLAHKGEIDIIGTIPEIWLGIPLFAEEKVIGAMVIQNYDYLEAYDKSTIEMLEMIAHGLGNYLSRKQVEAERERLSAAIEQGAESVIITDLQGTIQYVNPAFERITGYTRGEVLGQNPRILKSGSHDDLFYQNLWDTIAGGNTWHGQFINRRKDGSTITEDSSISPVFNAAGEIVHYVAVKRDITREKELEHQYRQAQKMESIGRLAGGVAHDFNNMLTVILGNTELAMRDIDPANPLYLDLQEIYNAGLRSAELTAQLLAFARKQAITPKLLNLNDTVGSMLTMLRRLIGEDINLLWLPGANLWHVKIDPAQVNQILANLCVNARDAISGVGRVTIETANVTFDKAYSQKHAYATPGSYVLLAVSDDGCGMDNETLAKIFEPFFTTRAPGESTGLGLATVYGIVKQNNGYINVYSEPGHGTTFKIYLPQYPEAGEPELEKTAEIARGLGERILLVEDEISILEMARTMLEKLGYTVITSNTPHEALRLAQEQPGNIDLLITDVVMPGMNGRELSNRLLAQFPGMQTLFMSGYTTNAIAHRGVLDEGVNFIHKPFSLLALATKVREVLEQ